MDLLVFAMFTVLPALLSAYFTYIFASVKGFPKVPLIAVSLVFGAIVPLILFFLKPRENINHPLYPGDNSETLMRTPAIIRRNPETSSKTEPGYLYLYDSKLIWVPRDAASGYVWDYEYGLPLGDSRVFKSNLLGWMIFPSNNKDAPVALSLGNAGSLARVHIASGINALQSGHTEIIEQLRDGKSIWKFGKRGKDTDE